MSNIFTLIKFIEEEKYDEIISVFSSYFYRKDYIKFITKNKKIPQSIKNQAIVEFLLRWRWMNSNIVSVQSNTAKIKENFYFFLFKLVVYLRQTKGSFYELFDFLIDYATKQNKLEATDFKVVTSFFYNYLNEKEKIAFQIAYPYLNLNYSLLPERQNK